ncbi:MAG TPA: hypothetical protein VM621_06660 [Luteibacter sp.]|uniref:hypothetical protein n=1 Tax=Luteibacter sp. TaxID=1886636 RepID=UPI002C6D1FB0|nr:hypothetical protein [Luteibacter sp.]HVI54717.1 hypothetical protein [Luteibacter sp.]
MRRFFILTARLGLVALLCFGGAVASAQGRADAPKPKPSPVELPDPSPGWVIEAGYTEDVEGTIMHRLGFLINVYAQGMHGYITDAARDLHGGVSESSLRKFRDQLLRGTFAFFEYSWHAGGVRHTRIYVSRSNHDFARYIPAGASDLSEPGTTEAHYLPDVGVFRFARTAVAVPGSTVLPSHDPQANRANDAEIKILQTLKSDIRLNPEMARGELVGFVSQRPCVSCSPALRRFASETGATVRINYVDGANLDGRRTPLFRALRQVREVAAALLVSYFFRAS